jgi:hypothetical protein
VTEQLKLLPAEIETVAFPVAESAFAPPSPFAPPASSEHEYDCVKPHVSVTPSTNMAEPDALQTSAAPMNDSEPSE